MLFSNISKWLIGINNYEISCSGRVVVNEMEYVFWCLRVCGFIFMMIKLVKIMMFVVRYNFYIMLKWYWMKIISSVVVVIL